MEQNNYLPNRFSDGCFGCSPDNHAGLKMRFKAEKDTVISDLSVPVHLCGWNGLIHGGVVATILDEIMSWSAIYLLKKMIMTKSINVEFLRPLNVGDQLTAKGGVEQISSKHEAIMQGTIFDSQKKICAKSRGIFATFSPKVAKRLGIIKDERVEWLVQLLSSGETTSN